MTMKSFLLRILLMTTLPLSQAFSMEDQDESTSYPNAYFFNQSDFEDVSPDNQFLLSLDLLLKQKSNIDPNPWGFFFSSWRQTGQLLMTPQESGIEELTPNQEEELKQNFKEMDGVPLWKIKGKIREEAKAFFEEGRKKDTELEDTSQRLSFKEIVGSIKVLKGIDTEFKKTDNNDTRKDLKGQAEEIIDSWIIRFFPNFINSGYKLKENKDEDESRLLTDSYTKKDNFLIQVVAPDLAHDVKDFQLSEGEKAGIEGREDYKKAKKSFIEAYNERIDKNNKALSVSTQAHGLTTGFSVAGGILGAYGTHKLFYNPLLKKGEELEETISPYLPQWVEKSAALSYVARGVIRNGLWVSANGAGFVVFSQLGHMAGAFVSRIIWGV